MNMNSDLATLKKIFLFRETTKYRSISTTALNLGLKQSNLSKAIKDLEIYLGTRLFGRIHNGVVLTEEGEYVIRQVQKIDESLHAIKSLSEESHAISGNISLWTTDGLGAWCVSTHLGEFYNKYPDVTIEIKCSNEIPDILPREADVAVVFEEPRTSSAKTISEHTLTFSLYASNSYISRYGRPKNLEDMKKNHRICDRGNFKDVWPKWAQLVGDAQHIVSTTNSSTVFMHLTQQGMGIGLQPDIVAGSDPDLQRLDLDFSLSHPFWVISHQNSEEREKVRTFIEFITKAITNPA